MEAIRVGSLLHLAFFLSLSEGNLLGRLIIVVISKQMSPLEQLQF